MSVNIIIRHQGNYRVMNFVVGKFQVYFCTIYIISYEHYVPFTVFADNTVDLKSSRASKNVSEKNTVFNAQSSANRSDSANAVVPKGKAALMDESSCSKNESVQGRGRISDSSSTVKSKDRHSSINEDDSSNDIRASDAFSSGPQTSMSKESVGDNSSGSSIKKAELDSQTNARRANSHAKYKPENWMLPDKSGERLMQLNLAIVSKQMHFSYLI